MHNQLFFKLSFYSLFFLSKKNDELSNTTSILGWLISDVKKENVFSPEIKKKQHKTSASWTVLFDIISLFPVIWEINLSLFVMAIGVVQYCIWNETFEIQPLEPLSVVILGVGSVCIPSIVTLLNCVLSLYRFPFQKGESFWTFFVTVVKIGVSFSISLFLLVGLLSAEKFENSEIGYGKRVSKAVVLGTGGYFCFTVLIFPWILSALQLCFSQSTSTWETKKWGEYVFWMSFYFSTFGAFFLIALSIGSIDQMCLVEDSLSYASSSKILCNTSLGLVVILYIVMTFLTSSTVFGLVGTLAGFLYSFFQLRKVFKTSIVPIKKTTQSFLRDDKDLFLSSLKDCVKRHEVPKKNMEHFIATFLKLDMEKTLEELKRMPHKFRRGFSYFGRTWDLLFTSVKKNQRQEKSQVSSFPSLSVVCCLFFFLFSFFFLAHRFFLFCFLFFFFCFLFVLFLFFPSLFFFSPPPLLFSPLSLLPPPPHCSGLSFS